MRMLFSEAVLSEFDAHCERLRAAARARRSEVTLHNNVVDRSESEVLDIRSTFGVMQQGEQWAGDAALRTLKALLGIIDENVCASCPSFHALLSVVSHALGACCCAQGFERSAHQVLFHDAMIRAISRVLYRADWATKRPDIMRKHGWERCPGEVLVSTPRRFGKTFSCVCARTGAHALAGHKCAPCTELRS